MKVFYLLLLLTLSAQCGRAAVGNSTNETEGPPLLAASLIGGPCGDATDCVGDPYSECQMGICRCRDGYVPSRSLFDCLEIMHEVGDECGENYQCTQGNLNGLSGCIDGECQCLTPQAVKVPEAEECVLVAELIGDDCKGVGQCTPNLGDDALCRETIEVGIKKCGCDESQSIPRLNGTHCLKFTNELGGPCEDIRQCRGGNPGPLSWCFEDICQCKDSIAVRIPGENKCLPKLGLGEGICFHDVQCEATLGHLGKCGETSEVCECREDGVPDREDRRCLHLVHLIGGECEEPQQCQLGAPGQYSNCVEDPSSDMKMRCACTHEAIELPGDSVCHKTEPTTWYTEATTSAEPTTTSPEITTPSEELAFRNQLVGRDEAISYAFDVPLYGIDIEVDVRLGEVVGYYSYTHMEPDELNNDGVVNHSGGTYIHYMAPFAQVFVRIQGVLVENIYDMIVRLRQH